LGKQRRGVIRVFMVAASSASESALEKLRKLKAVKVTGTAFGLESAEAQLSDTEPDVLLLDTTGERPEDLVNFLIESDLASDLPTVVLADSLPGESSAVLLRAGVRAVLDRNVPSDQLLSALQAVVSGLVVLPPEQIESVTASTRRASRQSDEQLEPLTSREHDVLEMLAAGLANKEIASRLEISEHTVKFHVASILGKLGAESRTEAVSQAFRRGLVLL